MYFAYKWIFHCFYNLNILSSLCNHTTSKNISSAGLGLCTYFTPSTKSRPTSKSTLCLWTCSLSAPVAKFGPFMHWVFDNPLKQCFSAYLSGHTKNLLFFIDTLASFTMFCLFPAISYVGCSQHWGYYISQYPIFPLKNFFLKAHRCDCWCLYGFVSHPSWLLNSNLRMLQNSM